jgi:SAM-dependent methyltransferase
MNYTKNLMKISIWGKLLIFVILLMIVVSIFSVKKEGFKNNKSFSFNESNNIYDTFYSNIYDLMVYSQIKNNYEIGEIINKTNLDERSIILDIGCGTGHHVGLLEDRGYNTIGIDESSAMISKAKNNYPESDFRIANVLNTNIFNYQTFTHILCLYFTIYYIENKEEFFRNCIGWLKPGGYLVVHLVDRDMFDPILPPANPLMLLTPQRYAKKRITKSKIKFDDFYYTANFELNNRDNIARFKEKFEFNDGKIKKQEHIMYMPTEKEIISIAQSVGFILQGNIDLIHTGYEYNNLYVFVKPN